jgi:hypothetical protein
MALYARSSPSSATPAEAARGVGASTHVGMNMIEQVHGATGQYPRSFSYDLLRPSTKTAYQLILQRRVALG